MLAKKKWKELCEIRKITTVGLQGVETPDIFYKNFMVRIIIYNRAS